MRLEVDPGNPVQDFNQAPGLLELPPKPTLWWLLSNLAVTFDGIFINFKFKIQQVAAELNIIPAAPQL